MSFMQEHEAEFFEDAAAVSAFHDLVTEEDELQVYCYPNSGEVSSTLPIKWIEDKENLNFSDLYRDEDGKIWVYVGYFMGPRDWVCLTDPLNPELPGSAKPEVELYPAAQLPPKSGLTNPTIAGILVAAAAAISVVLLRRKRK